MTLSIKFAKACRWLLTPIRKRIILNRMKVRLRKAHPRILSNYKYELGFMYKKKGDVRPFGITVILRDGTSIEGCAFRCGCLNMDKWQSGDSIIRESFRLHKELSEHGQVLSSYQMPRRIKKQIIDNNALNEINNNICSIQQTISSVHVPYTRKPPMRKGRG